jgi:uncharacterized membrane protein (UPF0127 family)
MLAERRNHRPEHARMPRFFPQLFMACAMLVLSACAAQAHGPWVELRGHRYNVEIADTEQQREQGLMFRDSLAPGSGMLFVHDAEQPLSYWMKNTRIPLDILYFDQQRHLVSVVTALPCSLGNACPPFSSEGPARYVLELNAGEAHKLHASKGDRIEFSKDIARITAH